MLEILSYHSLNEVEYINQLKKELSEQGLLEYEKKEVVKLEPSKRAKELVSKNKIFYVKNERYPREKAELIACKRDEVIKDLIALEVPFFSKDISEKKMEFDGKMEENYDFKRNFSFGEKLCFEVVAKAMNILKISMREVKLFNPDFKSKKEFYESFLRNLKFNFDKRQNFKKENQLELAKFILQNFKSALMKEQKQSYEVSNFEARELEETGVRSIFTSKKYKIANMSGFTIRSGVRIGIFRFY
ncbi:hypothetical protein [Campylobacter helveticus]|uniref:hypothetical protein n=1 Tax=Campylobacter helveticus TaxID=28898 RepID=UPI0022EB5969|nr:hypothetical protein [Campylobacter helveticus]